MDLEALLQEVRAHRQQSAENVKLIVAQTSLVNSKNNDKMDSKPLTKQVACPVIPKEEAVLIVEAPSDSVLPTDQRRELKLMHLQVIALEKENESLKGALAVVAHERGELVRAANATQETVNVLRRSDDRRSEQMQELRLRIDQARRDEEKMVRRERSAAAEATATRAQLEGALETAFELMQRFLFDSEGASRSVIVLEAESIEQFVQVSELELQLSKLHSEICTNASRHEIETETMRQALESCVKRTDNYLLLGINDQQLRCVNERHALVTQEEPENSQQLMMRVQTLSTTIGELEQKLANAQADLVVAHAAKRELQLRLAKELALKSDDTTPPITAGPSVTRAHSLSFVKCDDVSKLQRSCQTQLSGSDISARHEAAERLAADAERERQLRIHEQGERVRLEQTVRDLREHISKLDAALRDRTSEGKSLIDKCSTQADSLSRMEAEVKDLRTLCSCLKHDLTTASDALGLANGEVAALSYRVKSEVESARRALNMHARLHASEGELRAAVVAERKQWDYERSRLAEEILLLTSQLSEVRSAQQRMIDTSSTQTENDLPISQRQVQELPAVVTQSASSRTSPQVHPDENENRDALLQVERSHSAWLLRVAEDKDAENAQLRKDMHHIVKSLWDAHRMLAPGTVSSLYESQQHDSSTLVAAVEGIVAQMVEAVATARRDQVFTHEVLPGFLKIHEQLSSLLIDEEVSNAMAACQDVLLTTLDEEEAKVFSHDVSPLAANSIVAALGVAQGAFSCGSVNSTIISQVFDSWPQLAHRISVLCQLVRHHQSEFTKVRKAMFDLKAAFLAEAEARQELEQIVARAGRSSRGTTNAADDDANIKRVRLVEIADDAIAALQSGKGFLDQAVHSAEKICSGSEGSPVVQQLYEALDSLRAAIAAAQSCCDWVLDSYLGIVAVSPQRHR